MKVVIVGAGIHGLALAWALTRDRHQVLVLDRGPIPNPYNASYDQHRLIHDFNRATTDAPLNQAFDAWRTLSLDIGPIYIETGAVCGFPDAAAATRVLNDLRDRDIASRMLDTGALAGVLPDIRLDAGHCAIMTRRGGILLADQIALLLVRWLLGAGIALRPNTAVEHIDPERPAARLANGDTVTGDVLVTCAGASTRELLPDFAGVLGARRQILVYLEPPRHLEAAWRRAPVFVNFGGADDLWGAPSASGTHVKLAVGRFALPRPLGTLDAVVTAAETDALLGCFHPRMPQLGTYRVVRSSACFYSTAPEGHRLSQPHGGSGKAWFVAGHNGSDYKFAPAVALDLAARLGS
ncbi:FAD-dependent oxidoreductase [Bradyrhizobium sp. U87765 SZCCT0131]|uniref:NAD(P)/FAD-dependent oxidoreductase n=1 Tax=unclassified Bradyrhizobium TaxID=2631580 RepID=UPI001BAC58DC|nr:MULTISPECIES: FAD-dependent oxidoreductase [unclassified Bradyrhizobium]MBR1218513.1 FAD-dependent oxidoreductase [Bradyrhizobium sp. U87765 SZCCT0131]MBR1260541.1 FAD-dependent oxidoreductase [Bradyrhizobium sp. U87765 SZCCT0134]MBR1304011.1 FAD-dependent oxidoreductase [Bradyrhizobium sp. U87765 SZCCT0110]MBR1319617.1 FAD-dependent oxidoreductase [Bradyrhizobium sp. U87765 SZCCT0109]MBR1347942.1 FAD-dependent oxidoreductase [Bradyrhizobium sp. U87765 SZCCT0048]